ncbi:MAG: GPW/gp25 family protein [Chloroflexota bacterium]|jgi:phage baseplate assembly protein W
MAAPRYRAWEFLHPHLVLRGQVTVDAAGLQLTPQGGVAMVEDDESVRQAILLLLSTTPGERVMRPAYGCNLRRLAFAPNDDTTAGLAIHYVRRALEQWEPRVDIVNIDAARDVDDPARLDVELEYRVRSTQRTAALTVAVPLAGEGA